MTDDYLNEVPSDVEEVDDLEAMDAAQAAAEARSKKPAVVLSRQPMFQTLFEQSIAPDDTVLTDFARYVVGPLCEYFGMKAAKGGAFFRMKQEEGAKNTERYGRDQTLRAHLINGMLPARHIAKLLHEWKAQPMRHWDETVERLFIAGYMLHDFTKIDAAEKALLDAGFRKLEAPSERQIPTLEAIFREWCGKLGLDAFLEPVGGVERLLHDLIYVACNTQRYSGTAHAGTLLPDTALTANQDMLATNVSYLADLLAYVAASPRELVAHSTIKEALIKLAFKPSAPEKVAAKLVYHHVAENRGLLLNFIHNATLDVLRDEARVPLLFAPSGVVYLQRYDAPPMPAREALTQQIVSEIRFQVADKLVKKKKAIKLGKDGLRTDSVYRDAFDLREFVVASPRLAELVRNNAPQYMEKLVTLGYPGGANLPTYSTDKKDPRLRQMAEWASLLEIEFEARAPDLLAPFHQFVLERWQLDDLAEEFDINRAYKPARNEGTGIRYYWYWAAAHALARSKPGISPEEVWENLAQISDELAALLPEALPKTALPNEGIWLDLTDYVSRVLTFSGTEIAQLWQRDELTRYARAKAGRGGAICAICGDTYTTRKPAETAVAFQPGVYTARIRIGASDNKRNLCSICALEQLLRQLFVDNLDSGGTAEEQRIRYLAFYPSYFFTPETLQLMYRVYKRLVGLRLSDKELRAALNAQASNGAAHNGHSKHPLEDATFWQRLDNFLIPAERESESKRVLRYSEGAQGTFLMVGLRNFNDPTDVESWVLPAFLSLVLPVCLDVKVVASDSGVPLLLEAGELPETVWFDGAHAAIQALVVDPTRKDARMRLDVDEVMPALARLAAAYLIHLDTEYDPPDENWRRLPPIAHDLTTSPLYVFHYLSKQARDDKRTTPIGAAQLRRYVSFAESVFNQQGDVRMSHARELVLLYRQFYRAKNFDNANSVLRPLSVVSDALLVADPRLFSDKDALVEVAYGELYRFMDRVSSGQADGRFPKGVSASERDQAMRLFCQKFVQDIFIGVFKQDVAALRGKQLNLLRSACEAIYRDEQLREWAERGRDAGEPEASEVIES